MKKNVLITGGTGFIGRHMTDLLIDRGFTVSILSRGKKENVANIFYYTWDVANQKIEEEAVLNADYIIHLAGENIAGKRWTKKRKEEIIDSRDKSIQLIYSVLKKNKKIPEAFISASAVGIYGAINGRAICTENMTVANDFLGVTCKKWEAAADRIGNLGIRTVKIRTGLVLGKNDGFLNKLLPLFKWNLGAALGSGEQYMPWIHVSDLCRIYLEAITNPKMEGPYNAAINDDTTNTIFSKTLARLCGHSLWLPNVPAFVLKIMMGEMAKIVLTGRRVSSDKIESTGFYFEHKNLENTLKICLP
tara:strand:+ start:8098 stop:9009 length:912 start_codon:yes stop_codon:yes gene_type:complete